jgi:hypothetical protein
MSAICVITILTQNFAFEKSYFNYNNFMRFWKLKRHSSLRLKYAHYFDDILDEGGGGGGGGGGFVTDWVSLPGTPVNGASSREEMSE